MEIGRYVTDINICKADSRGFHYSVNGDCIGTAVYLSADNTVGLSTFMWGIHYSGLRIAGAFAYGIRCVNIDDGWMHEMRIDAFIDACEIGVCLEDCKNTYVSAIVQPRRAYTMDKVYKPYAKHGIKLVRSKNTDLSGSRVWDWDADKTLWTDGGEYQQIAMIGDCSGAILNDFRYHNVGYDTRKCIYTDTLSNLEMLTILQEPIDRWFKVKNGDPYYNTGSFDKKLITEEVLAEHFTTDLVKNFTDVLPTATDTDGTVYGDVGYKNGYLGSQGSIVESPYYAVTGFIPIKSGQTFYVHDMTYATYDGLCRISVYDANKNHIRSLGASGFVSGNNWHFGYTVLPYGFSATINAVADNANVAYVRFSVYKRNVGAYPMVSIDEPIKYTIEGFLADGVKVKGENVIGEVGVEQPDWIAKKTVTEGAIVWEERDVVFANATAYCSENGGSFKVDNGCEYDVYWNGTLYQCEEKTYDSEPYIGNGSLGLYGAPNTGEPFCLYGSFLAPDTIAYIKKDTTTAETVKIKVTMKGEVEYSKLPKEYLPDEAALKTDIPDAVINPPTAEVGQTIVVKEVDENGKPTKWESAEYQPRTHYNKGTKEVDILAEMSVTGMLDDTLGMYAYVYDNLFKLNEGHQYNVIFDGVEYSGLEACVATVKGAVAVAIGNLSLIGGGGADIPFIAMNITINDTSGLILFDENEHSVRIYEATEDVQKIPAKYLPDGLPYSETDYKTFFIGAVTIEMSGFYLINHTIPLVVGETYTVVFDGISYTCICQVFTDDILYCGNLKFADDVNTVPDTGEPFIIAVQKNGFSSIGGERGSHTVSISGYKETVHMLDAKYNSAQFYINGEINDNTVTIFTNKEEVRNILTMHDEQKGDVVLRLVDGFSSTREFRIVSNCYGTHNFMRTFIDISRVYVENVGIYVDGEVRSYELREMALVEA